MKNKNIKKIAKLYRDYTMIDCATDLKRRKLTLSDYHIIPKLANDIQKYGKTATFIESIANYFKKFGFDVELDENNVNYIIKIDIN